MSERSHSGRKNPERSRTEDNQSGAPILGAIMATMSDLLGNFENSLAGEASKQAVWVRDLALNVRDPKFWQPTEFA
jgi:hypothetical protein